MSLLTASLVLASCGGPAPAPVYTVVLPSNPNAQHGGKTYSEWAVDWWQWALSQPGSSHPLLDTTGADALRGQSGNVIFLGGTFNTAETVTRNVAVPLGSALFFPIYTWEADDFADPELTLEQRKQMLADFAGEVTGLFLTIDGQSASNLISLRATPPAAFTATLPEDNLFTHFGFPDVPASISLVADGYWAYIEPLPAGTHVLRFGGEHHPGSLDATYNITVE